jgi:branched-chain amino acid transport system ATP-binding protein
MLIIDRLSGGYRGGSVLFDVSLTVGAGEIVALIGPNGAGKTSVLRAISRTLPQSRGGISLGGEDLTRCAGHQVVAMGVAHVPEGRRVFPRLTVRDNIALGAFVLDDHAKTEEALTSVCEAFPVLKARLEQLAGTLSGGEQQMLALARGLVSNPKLMLLDEPSLGLSPRMTDEVFALIQRLRTGGRSILLVEQNAMLALEIADRGYVIEGGRIVTEGRSEELRQAELLQQSYLGHAG